jgi:hypothetical protein
MPLYARASLLLGVVLFTASCSDTDARLVTTGPSGIDSASLAVEPTSATAFAEPVGGSICPSVAPFNVRFGLSVTTTDWSSVIITGITAQFTDASGARAPQVTLPAPGPTPVFGSAMPPPGSARMFPLSVGVGCGTDIRGTLIVTVETSDRRGRRGAQHVTIAVR